jgi:2-dehydro-3-deoxyphosphogluconate aldolase/(4S)-4-hydroxy-2-oxoglutarate aldolase
MSDPTVFEQVKSLGLVSVLVLDRVEDAAPLAEALLAGGVGAMELTLRTPIALDALRAIRRQVPRMLAGVGTILTPAQVEQVVAAGGAFGVAPGLNPRVVEAAQRLELPFAPGVCTPSEVERGLELGCKLLKLFPAEPSGGLKYLQSIHAPYAHLGVKFLPLGGVTEENLASYLREPAVGAVGGTWLAPRAAVQEGKWDAIREAARRAIAIRDQVRGGGPRA